MRVRSERSCAVSFRPTSHLRSCRWSGSPSRGPSASRWQARLSRCSARSACAGSELGRHPRACLCGSVRRRAARAGRRPARGRRLADAGVRRGRLAPGGALGGRLHALLLRVLRPRRGRAGVRRRGRHRGRDQPLHAAVRVRPGVDAAPRLRRRGPAHRYREPAPARPAPATLLLDPRDVPGPVVRAARLLAYSASRLVLALLRSIPELVWVLLCILAVGLGPFAGALALGLHTAGVLGKLYAETLEEVPDGPVEELRAAGATRPQRLLWAMWPQAREMLLGYTLLRWETNLRVSTVVGLVGGG